MTDDARARAAAELTYGELQRLTAGYGTSELYERILKEKADAVAQAVAERDAEITNLKGWITVGDEALAKLRAAFAISSTDREREQAEEIARLKKGQEVMSVVIERAVAAERERLSLVARDMIQTGGDDLAWRVYAALRAPGQPT